MNFDLERKRHAGRGILLKAMEELDELGLQLAGVDFGELQIELKDGDAVARPARKVRGGARSKAAPAAEGASKKKCLACGKDIGTRKRKWDLCPDHSKKWSALHSRDPKTTLETFCRTQS